MAPSTAELYMPRRYYNGPKCALSGFVDKSGNFAEKLLQFCREIWYPHRRARTVATLLTDASAEAAALSSTSQALSATAQTAAAARADAQTIMRRLREQRWRCGRPRAATELWR